MVIPSYIDIRYQEQRAFLKLSHIDDYEKLRAAIEGENRFLDFADGCFLLKTTAGKNEISKKEYISYVKLRMRRTGFRRNRRIDKTAKVNTKSVPLKKRKELNKNNGSKRKR